jgi:hypothetical protein
VRRRERGVCAVADSDAGLFVAVIIPAMDPGWIETRLGKKLGFASELLSQAVDHVGGSRRNGARRGDAYRDRWWVVVDYKPSSVEIIIDGTIEPSCGRPSRRAPLLFFVPPLLVREMFVCF